jgi:uncharacterized protein (DUF4415 family)
MASEDTKLYSRSDVAAMKARGEVRATPADAPEIELDEAFWEKARIVATRPRRKSSVHLRLDPATLEFYRSGGRGHLTRMADVLKAYAEAQAQSKHSRPRQPVRERAKAPSGAGERQRRTK